MLTQFQTYLSDKIDLSAEDIALIASVAKTKRLKKKQFLLQQGEICRHNIFVARGFLKTFSVDANGKEHIINLAPENYWAGDRDSLTYQTPSSFNIDAIEDSEVVLIGKDDFEMLCLKMPHFNDLINRILHKSFIASQNRIHASISLSAEQKYQNFLDKFPALVRRIPQHMIASYIGITPETLTRIRRNASRS